MTWPQLGVSCLGRVFFWVVFSSIFYFQIITLGLNLIPIHNLLCGGVVIKA